MEVAFFACGENALLDSSSNSASLINILDDFSVAQFPFFIPKISMLAIFRKSAGDDDQVNLETVIKHGKTELFRSPHTIEFGGANTTRHFGNLHGLLIPGVGILTVSIHRDGKSIAKWTVRIDHEVIQG